MATKQNATRDTEDRDFLSSNREPYDAPYPEPYRYASSADENDPNANKPLGLVTDKNGFTVDPTVPDRKGDAASEATGEAPPSGDPDAQPKRPADDNSGRHVRSAEMTPPTKKSQGSGATVDKPKQQTKSSSSSGPKSTTSSSSGSKQSSSKK